MIDPSLVTFIPLSITDCFLLVKMSLCLLEVMSVLSRLSRLDSLKGYGWGGGTDIPTGSPHVAIMGMSLMKDK